MPKDENPKPATAAPAPYCPPSGCHVTWRARVVRPRGPDGGLLNEEHVSQRWADATIKCHAEGGNYEAEDIWIMTRDVKAGAKRVESLRQIQYHFKRAAHTCGCGNKRHEILLIEEVCLKPRDEVPEKDGEPDFTTWEEKKD